MRCLRSRSGVKQDPFSVRYRRGVCVPPPTRPPHYRPIFKEGGLLLNSGS
uniref:Uncharacterized protein n=1 Tax=Paramormyrops kingsleyae TaxID=1676925 RepID=A0A3B3S4Q0_9TELE